MSWTTRRSPWPDWRPGTGIAAFAPFKKPLRNELTETDAISELLDHLAVALPDEQRISEKSEQAAAATIELLTHLWTSQGKAAEHVAWRIPMLASDGTARLAGRRRLMLPPIGAWPEAARPFADAYPRGRVLADRYMAADGTYPTAENLSFVHNAESSDVPIRNTTALRYAVPPELWKEGLNIDGTAARTWPR